MDTTFPALMPNKERRVTYYPTLPALSGGGRIEQSRPGKGATLTILDASNCLSVRFLANFFAGALARQRSFDPLFLSRLQVEGMALDFLDDVLLLHLALEAAQSVFQGFTFLQSNFRQTDTPPNPSGRTE